MKFLLLMLTLFIPLHTGATTATGHFENHHEIREQARLFALQQANDLGKEIAVTINNIDQRLKLKKCPTDLQIKPIRGHFKPGRNTMSISCHAETPWRIFVTSNIQVYKNIYVAKNILPKGAVVNDGDLISKRIDITSLHKQYLTAKSSIVNQSVKRQIAKGGLFTTYNLANQLLIKKGDLINITAARNGFEINMKGIALASGSVGQRITVKNSKTKRVVQGTVTSKATVRVQI